MKKKVFTKTNRQTKTFFLLSLQNFSILKFFLQIIFNLSSDTYCPVGAKIKSVIFGSILARTAKVILNVVVCQIINKKSLNQLINQSINQSIHKIKKFRWLATVSQIFPLLHVGRIPQQKWRSISSFFSYNQLKLKLRVFSKLSCCSDNLLRNDNASNLLTNDWAFV